MTTNTITKTDHTGATLTIPTDSNGLTSAQWVEDGEVILEAPAWYYPAEGKMFLPADCQGSRDSYVDADGMAIGSWVDGEDGQDAVLVDGRPVMAW